MKKLFVVTLVAFFVGLISVSAMSEKDLRKRFDESITIGGTTYVVKAGDKKLVDDYLAKYEVSDKDCKYISGKIDEAIKIVKAEGTADAKAFSKDAKTKLKALVADIAANTSVKATVTNGSLIILNNNGTTFAEVDSLVKKTGTTDNVAIIAGVASVITLVGACLVIRQTKKSN